MEAQVNALVAEQREAMRQLTRIMPNLKKSGEAKITPVVLRNRIERVRELRAAVNARHYKLIALATKEIKTDCDYFTDGSFDDCEDNTTDLLDQLEARLVSFTPTVEKVMTTTSVVPTHIDRPAIKLPTIELPRFDGSYTQWEQFRARFTTLVIKNPRLTNFEKMHYLHTTLSGAAGKAIAHLEVTDENFLVAWDLIRSRFEHKRRIAFAHLDALFALPTMLAKSSDSLRALRDDLMVAKISLSRVIPEVEHWDALFVYMIAIRMDTCTRAAWEQEICSTKDVPTFKHLDQFLDNHIHFLASTGPAIHEKKPVSKPINSLRNVSTHATQAIKSACIVCEQAHALYQCSTFGSQSVQQRKQIVTDNKLCYNCLRDHFVAHCSSTYRCRRCGEKHHTLLHSAEQLNTTDVSDTNSVPMPSPADPAIASHKASISQTTLQGRVLLATARVKVHSPNGRTAVFRALLDQGSEATLISENLAQLLRLPRTKRTTLVTGVGNAQSTAHYSAPIKIGPVTSQTPLESTVAIILSSLTKFVPPRGNHRQSWAHLADLPLADNDPFSSDPMDLIIGADCYGRLLRPGLRHGQDHEPTAQETAFGWVLSGKIADGNASTVSTHIASLGRLDAQLRQFWEIEDMPPQQHLTPDEQRCEEHFASTHLRTTSGRYIVRLPFQSERPNGFQQSRATALTHLNRLHRRLQRNEKMAREYDAFLAEYEALGHMERVREPSIDLVNYYIPHHAVIRESSLTTRLRVVFNASSRVPGGGSLNEHLSVGPKLQSDLIAILLRWRQHRYVYTADIEKMYRQILVHPNDQDYQRILWRSSPQSAVVDYRLLTVTYGTTCAPYLALRVLQQLTTDEGQSFPLAVPILTSQTYVDDCIFGADDAITAMNIRDQLIGLLSRGGFHLRKWASNDPNLLTGLNPEDHGLGSKSLHSDDSLKILGIEWHPMPDVIKVTVSKPLFTLITKRTILSVVAGLFDPLGLIAPVVASAKIFLQDLWKQKCGWDDALPADASNTWMRFATQLPVLSEISFPRWTTQGSQTRELELHGFADASTKAYAAAVYIRVVSMTDSPTITLVLAKTRVAPVKTISVPRLELCAAVLLTKLMRFVRESLHLHAAPCYCWSDSTVTLEWLSQHPSRWDTFVANRVSKIQEFGDTAQWRHVPTHDNPADCASRGLAPSELHQHPLWWSGPRWLHVPDASWPATPLIRDTALHAEQPLVCSTHVIAADDVLHLQDRYSSWRKLIRITAILLQFITQLRRRRDPANLTSADRADCHHRATIHWLRHVQRAAFPAEIESLQQRGVVSRSSPLSCLSPYIDPDGLLRARGRLRHAALPDSAKHPVLLASHPLIRRLIYDLHQEVLHGGPQLTLARLRQEYWLLRARPIIRSVLYHCIPCTRARATTPEQFMGDLPRARVNSTARPFVHTGIDYAGPISVRSGSGRKTSPRKTYIGVFICMATKALHLELVSDYSSDAFLAAFHRFVSRRGIPSDVYSDNGTTFRGADRELSATLRACQRAPSLTNYTADHNVTWHYIPPAAPHFGGLWEAAVRSVKHHLRRCIGAHLLTYEELTTLLSRIEACLNSRPLAALSDHIDDYNYLTPGHFLIGSALVAIPEPTVLSITDNRLSRWQMISKITEAFWQSWRQDYLHTLHQRPKWRDQQRLVSVGQLVLLRDQGLPPSHWPLGRIVECHPGDDGLTRVVTVRTSTSLFKRPITKICFLPININEMQEAESAMAGGSEPSDNPSRRAASPELSPDTNPVPPDHLT